MASNAALRWLDGRGWLVLAGSVHDAESIRARVLGVAAADGGLAVVVTQGEDAGAEQILTELEDLGAQSGYLVDVLAEDDLAVREKLADAGIVIISADDKVATLRSALLGAAIEGVQVAYENGAVVLVEGPGVMVFGAWVMLDEGGITTGFEWLQSALIVPGVESVADAAVTKIVMDLQPATLAVGVGAGSALALGPDGQVETWGHQQVTIALGPEFGA